MRHSSRGSVRSAAPLLLLCWALASSTSHAGPRAALTFLERVAAQDRIERTYYGHRIGATLPFDERIPKGLAEAKVRRYLKQSAALAVLWHTPVTAEMLRAEMERQARQTRMPERLRELHAALGDDPILIQECLARPALVDRLARSFYAFDGRLHAGARATAEAVRAGLLRDGIDSPAAVAQRTEVEIVALDPDDPEPELERNQDSRHDRITLPAEEFALWRRRAPERTGEIGPVSEQRDAFAIRVVQEEEPGRARILSFRVPKQSWEEWWAEVSGRLDEHEIETVAEGGLPSVGTPLGSATSWDNEPTALPSVASATAACLPDDTWDNGSLDDLPLARTHHTAVWTGSTMVVWGGQDSTSQPLATGGRYDPATDTWSPISTSGAPSPRWDHTAVWTSDRMVVWGGYDGSSYLGTGGRYDPSLDAWTATSTTGAPVGRATHTAAWTGARMVVWGGYDGSSYLGTGGRYDPGTDSWMGTSATGAPTGRGNHTVVWTGTRMIVWGGYDGLYQPTGGRYDPVADAWTATSTTLAPTLRDRHTAVWTGSRMIVWGGGNAGSLRGDGSRYDPVADSWTAVTMLGAPQARQHHSAIWTGSVMVVWGGNTSSTSASPTASGGRYDPAADSWSTTSIVGAPRFRFRHTAVWTGSQMVVWGGDDGFGSPPSSGGRYNPVTNTWTPTSIGPPVGWTEMTNVWTGNFMIVWGGRREEAGEALGGRYDPTIDSWAATSTVGAPTPRVRHTAVWTGSRMVVWGGYNVSPLNSGGRYDPTADTWQAVSTTDAPSPRESHTAVWTGSVMVIWGGTLDPVSSSLSTGGRYDPGADLWTVTSPWGAPLRRYAHTATWTGTWMVVWGGYSTQIFGVLASGARYEPVTDTWEPTSLAEAPTARQGHSAVWVSGRVVVWGGTGPTATGARYDPQGNVWLPTTLTGAPSARGSHSAVSTGGEMIMWGGSDSVELLDSGARYNPSTDSWLPTSTVGAPPKREGHTAVWTGSSMIVWGGSYGAGSGGRYALGHASDDDGDGSSECGGDCDDAQPAIHPGAVELCDGRDNDCDAATDEDDDGDGVAVCLDCLDTNATVHATPGEVESLILPSPTLLTWSPPAAPGGSAISYSTLRSAAAGSFNGGAACVESQDGSDTSATDVAVPPSKGIFFYLVRAENACPTGQGTLGAASSGNERLGRTCP